MNTNTNQNDHHDVIPDKKNSPLMTNSAWNLLIAALWPHSIYDDKIRSLIDEAYDPYDAYAEFCQRVIMARRYILQNPEYKISCSITEWLHSSNKNGYAGTAVWFERLQEKRKENRTYLIELKAFPEAMLELADDPAKDNFNYWSNWFLERKTNDHHLLLQLVGVKVFMDREEMFRELSR